MEIKAQLNSLRLAPRKVRAVANLLKGKNVNDALSQLEYFVRRPSEPIKKLLNSAIANAENNFSMVKDNLFIKSIIVDEGVKLKRMRAKGFGRSAAIQKKTSHISIILGEYTAGLRKEKAARVKKETGEVIKEETRAHDFKKPEVKREIIGPKKGVFGGLGKRLFQRKAV
ncbi:MAG: 50S ribosomal protein L22 [bacterium]|nr:50S ribosomal protein L22 [bacterium]